MATELSLWLINLPRGKQHTEEIQHSIAFSKHVLFTHDTEHAAQLLMQSTVVLEVC